MPTYEYKCPEGHEFELFQRMSDEPGAVCPECGQNAQRQFSTGGGFLFKGDGFYITDYRSPEYKKKAKAEKSGGEGGSGDGASSGGGTKKADSPPATSSGGASSGSSSPSTD